MKYLLIILLFISGCADNKEQEKITELQNIISSIEKQDFSIFDNYFSKNELYPIFFLQDTVFIDPDYDNIETKLIIYTNKGQTITYTNKYGFLFPEESKILVSYNEIQSIAGQISEIRNNELIWIYRQLSQPINKQDTRMKDSLIFNTLLYANNQVLIQILTNNISYNNSSKTLQKITSSLLNILSVDNNKLYQQYLFIRSLGNNELQQSIALKNYFILSLYFSWYDILFYGYGYQKDYFTVSQPIKMQAPIIYP
ncbi:MAG: hypothetical protein ACRC0X_01395 [Brevinema sp.]